MPITFVIDHAEQHSFQTNLDRFILYFNTVEKNKHLPLTQLNAAIANHPNFQRRAGHAKASLLMKDAMHDGHNLWVLKPNDANRGRGVTLFSSID